MYPNQPRSRSRPFAKIERIDGHSSGGQCGESRAGSVTRLQDATLDARRTPRSGRFWSSLSFCVGHGTSRGARAGGGAGDIFPLMGPLSRFIREHTEEILAEWETFARSRPIEAERIRATDVIWG